MSTPQTPKIPGMTDLTYNSYLKVPELLQLQKPQSEPEHHDEMLFIVIHQAYELWFKLMLHEMEYAIEYMQKKNVLRAHHFVNRVVQIQKLLVNQIHILETMTPAEFLGFRDRLMPASGFQSSQFREVEFLAGAKDTRYLAFFKDQKDFLAKLERRLREPDLRSAFYSMLTALGYQIDKEASQIEAQIAGQPTEGTPLQADVEAKKDSILRGLLPIYKNPSEHLPVYLLAESLVEFDEYIGLWREHHVRVVERVIGFKRGTGGSSGVQYLKSTTGKKCFPLLWEVRTYLDQGVR